ncbi:MAG: sigma-70 family RNA polymerase sigma factor [Vicinamibacterales bacterium]
MVEHARARHAHKRGGQAARVALDEAVVAAPADPAALDLEDLDRALTRLASFDPRQARIVELRYFAGLSVDETAAVVGVSARTVKREWQMARAWLRREMAPSEPDSRITE